MDVKEAVRTAKQYIKDLFINEDEGITNVGLEEVVFDDRKHAWKVTIGFSRAWNQGFTGGRRSFKVVQIDDRTGRVVSMTHRTLSDALN